jgi:DNA-binding beta-propeller fold protein YncE
VRLARIASVVGVCATTVVGLTVVGGADAAADPSKSGASSDRAGGAQVWVSRDTGPQNAYDRVGGMAVSPDGSTVYVARTSGRVFAVVARDASTGMRTWAVRTSGPGGAQIFAEAVALSPDGSRLFVTGDVEETIDERSAFTVAYDSSDGSILWSAQRLVGNNKEFIPRRIAVSPGGARLFVTGSRTGKHGINDFWDYLTVGYSTADGSKMWSAAYDGPAHRGDTAEGIGISPDGNRVFVTGTSAASGDSRDFATIAYAAADGSEEWSSRFVAGADNFASDLVVGLTGSRVYVAGLGRPPLNVPYSYRLVSYNAVTGAQAGVARYADGRNDNASDLTISSDGSRLFVTGSGGPDFLTVAFDVPLHAPLWAARYDGGHGSDNAYSLAVNPDGTRVYVTGESETGRIACFGEVPSTAYATVAYHAATGSPGWVSRYGGLSKHPDSARQVAVSPDGSLVFVTGDSDSGCTGSDVATLAYAR